MWVPRSKDLSVTFIAVDLRLDQCPEHSRHSRNIFKNWIQMNTSAACISWSEALLNHSSGSLILTRGLQCRLRLFAQFWPRQKSHQGSCQEKIYLGIEFILLLLRLCPWALSLDHGSLLHMALRVHLIWWWIQHPSPQGGSLMHLYAKTAMLYFWISSSACYADFPFGSSH